MFVSRLGRETIAGGRRAMMKFVQRRGDGGEPEWCVAADDYDYHREIARSAFADMLHDLERNDKYFEALKLAVDETHRRGKRANVLDIGTGTGLLAMMAARCGADSIVACETFRPMAECATEIVSGNGFGERIALVPKRSTELTVGEGGDLERRANVLVTEVFDTELIGEGAIETFAHAHAELLEPDCVVVPDSATVYAQPVECDEFDRWNRLADVAFDEGTAIVRAPRSVKECAGSAAVHDVQLSQLRLASFRPVSAPIAVFNFDWSGKTRLKKRRMNRFPIKSLISGKTQMVFMWWELNMDPKGEIKLSCAPWWNHPDRNDTRQHPEDSIPWRDHWMQAIYYFPRSVPVTKDEELVLCSAHDEFSLWFDIQKQGETSKDLSLRPVCDCEIHTVYSHTHLAYMNDNLKNRIFCRTLKKYVKDNSVCLCFNTASLVGIMAAKLGAKKVIYVESGFKEKSILLRFIEENDLFDKISIIPDVESLSENDKNELTSVICDPHFNSSLLPWDNLQFVKHILKLEQILQCKIESIPSSCSIWTMSVEFLDLHKIKIPLREYKGISFDHFDNLIKNSRLKSDDDIEPQPLWEYPCICRTLPIEIAHITFTDVKNLDKIFEGVYQCEMEGAYNGFVFWVTWNLDQENVINTGPIQNPELDKRIIWDPHIRQAVKILDENQFQRIGDKLKYSLKYNVTNNKVDVDVSIDCN